MLLALAYVALLAIVALGVPLALNLRDRVDSEVRGQARNQADVVAATAADLLDRGSRARLQQHPFALGAGLFQRLLGGAHRCGLLRDARALHRDVRPMLDPFRVGIVARELLRPRQRPTGL